MARQLGISSGQGEINAEANTSLSRFLALALMNLAGYYVGQNRMGTFGYLHPWCLVEDEEACRRVGWQTWNEQQGLDINDNSVTLSSALMWGNNMAPSTIDPERVMQLMAWDISERCQFALGSGKQDGGEHTFNQYLSHIISTEGGEETTTPVWYDTPLPWGGAGVGLHFP